MLQLVGIVFPSVALASGAGLDATYIVLDIDEVNAGESDQPLTLTISGEASANAAMPSDATHDLSSRSRTSNKAARLTWKISVQYGFTSPSPKAGRSSNYTLYRL